jgi:hypothetical protein
MEEARQCRALSLLAADGEGMRQGLPRTRYLGLLLPLFLVFHALQDKMPATLFLQFVPFACQARLLQAQLACRHFLNARAAHVHAVLNFPHQLQAPLQALHRAFLQHELLLPFRSGAGKGDRTWLLGPGLLQPRGLLLDETFKSILDPFSLIMLALDLRDEGLAVLILDRGPVQQTCLFRLFLAGVLHEAVGLRLGVAGAADRLLGCSGLLLNLLPL